MHDILVHVLAEHQQISPALEKGWVSSCIRPQILESFGYNCSLLSARIAFPANNCLDQLLARFIKRCFYVNDCCIGLSYHTIPFIGQ
jgi:hypothetical protein